MMRIQALFSNDMMAKYVIITKMKSLKKTASYPVESKVHCSVGRDNQLILNSAVQYTNNRQQT